MRRLLLAVFLGSIISGCGTHAYRVDENELILILSAPQAKRVTLACSLDGFIPRSARNVSGCWEVSLPADKTFTYFYWVDGHVVVPDCQLKEHDDFGAENCIFDPHL